MKNAFDGLISTDWGKTLGPRGFISGNPEKPTSKRTKDWKNKTKQNIQGM